MESLKKMYANYLEMCWGMGVNEPVSFKEFKEVYS